MRFFILVIYINIKTHIKKQLHHTKYTSAFTHGVVNLANMSRRITEEEGRYLFRIARNYQNEDGTFEVGAFAKIRDDAALLGLTIAQILSYFKAQKKNSNKYKKFKPNNTQKAMQISQFFLDLMRSKRKNTTSQKFTKLFKRNMRS